MTTAEEQQAKNRRLIQETLGILTVMVPAVGYISAYMLEIGFCRHFAIPPAYISLDLTYVVMTIGITLIFTAVALGVLLVPLVIRGAISRFSGGRVGPIWIRVITMSLYLIITIALALQYPLLIHSFPILSGFWVLIALYDFLGPLIGNRSGGSYRDKLREHDELLPGMVARLTVGKEVILLGIALLLMICFSYLEGTKEAANQREFLLPESHPGYAVLRKYGDNIICVAYTEEKQAKKEYIIINQRQVQDEKYSWRSIGPLRPAE